jgi:hypothetical protein
MKVNVARGWAADGAVYQLDTVTNITKNLAWSAPAEIDRIAAFYLGDSKVRCVLSTISVVLTDALQGETLPTAPVAKVTPLPSIQMPSYGMYFTPDGRFAFGLSNGQTSWVAVDFSMPTPVALLQDRGAFPENGQPSFMCFRNSSSRLVYIDTDAKAMYLSTPIANGQALNVALTVPLPDVPEAKNYEECVALGTVALGALAVAAEAAGLGAATVMDSWLVEVDGGEIFAYPQQGLCTAPADDGEQRVGYFRGQTVKELVVRQDFSYKQSYSSELPGDLNDGTGLTSIFFEFEAVYEPERFWRNFVRCFEEA